MGPFVRCRERAFALAAAIVLFSTRRGSRRPSCRVPARTCRRCSTRPCRATSSCSKPARRSSGTSCSNVKSGAGTSRCDRPRRRPAAARRHADDTGERSCSCPSSSHRTTLPALRTAAGAHHWRLLFLEFGPNNLGYERDRPSRRRMDRTVVAVAGTVRDRRRSRLHPRTSALRSEARHRHERPRRDHPKLVDLATSRRSASTPRPSAAGTGPARCVIENNYLEATGENVLFGGADPAIPGLVTEDVIVRRNYVTRPMSWRDPIVPTTCGTSVRNVTTGSLAGRQLQLSRRRPPGRRRRHHRRSGASADVVRRRRGRRGAPDVERGARRARTTSSMAAAVWSDRRPLGRSRRPASRHGGTGTAGTVHRPATSGRSRISSS